MAYVDNVRTTLHAAITSTSSTTVKVVKADTSKYNDIPSSGSITIRDSLSAPTKVAETISYTGRTDNTTYWTLTGVTRGAENTTANTWLAGHPVYQAMTAQVLNTMYDHSQSSASSNVIDVDTGALTGAAVVSDVDIHLATNTHGHVTGASATVDTRNLTLSDIGYTGTTDATTNATDAALRNRALHTGFQPISSVTNLQTELDGKQDNLTFGIADTNALRVDSADVADDEFARFTANGLEGRTAAEMRSDINVADGATANATDAALRNRSLHTGFQPISSVTNLQTELDDKQDNLTFGIANTNALKVDDSNAASNDFARFTSTGLEGRSASEVLTDLNITFGASAGNVPKLDTAISGNTAGTILIGTNTGISTITPAQLRNHLNIEDGATADQSDAEIRTAVDNAYDSNVFTDALLTKLNGIATGATNTSFSQVSSSEIAAGTATIVRRYSPADIKSFVNTHQTDTTYSVGDGGLSENNLTNTLKTNYDSAYSHSQSTHAPTDATATNATNIAAAGGVLKSDYPIDTILYANSAGAPVAVTLANFRALLNEPDDKGKVIYSQTRWSNSNFSLPTIGGCTITWNATYKQITFTVDSSWSYADVYIQKLDGSGGSTSTFRTWTDDLSVSSGNTYFITGTRDSDFDMEDYAAYASIGIMKEGVINSSIRLDLMISNTNVVSIIATEIGT